MNHLDHNSVLLGKIILQEEIIYGLRRKQQKTQ